MSSREAQRELSLEELLAQALDADMPDGEKTEPLADAEIAELLSGQAPPHRQGNLVDRLVADPAAAREVKALAPLRLWSRRFSEAIEQQHKAKLDSVPAHSRWSRGLFALAAALILTIGLVFFLPSASFLLDPREDAYRGEDEVELRPRPAHGQVLADVPEALRWNASAVPADCRTRVLLFDAYAALLWQSSWRDHPNSASAFVLPAAVRERLNQGGSFFWRLAIDDGLEERLGPLTGFEIRP